MDWKVLYVLCNMREILSKKMRKKLCTFKNYSDICTNQPWLTMTQITNFSQIFEHLAQKGVRKTIAVVCPADECTQTAIAHALAKGLADFLLFCTPGTELQAPIAASPAVKVEEASTPDAAAAAAVHAVKDGRAQILMKGLINTDNFLRAVLNKEQGLLPPGNVLTHLSVAQMPGYHKLLFFSDVAVIPYPTLEQKVAVIGYDVAVCRKFGIEVPKVALIHFTEKVNDRFPNSVHCLQLEAMAAEGLFGPVEMGGPMDVKTACDRHSAEVKGIESAVCGNADLLIFPNIESGNTFYKTVTFFAGADIAGVLQGALCPVVLPSRSDSWQSKLSSMAVACLSAD